MTVSYWHACARSAAAGASCALGADIPLSAVRVPARGAELGVRLPFAAPDTELLQNAAKALERFPKVCAVSPFSECRMRGEFLLLSVSVPLLDAAMAGTCSALPPAGSDCGSLALNRMLLLAQKGPAPCPEAPAVRHAFWLALGLEAESAAPCEAPHFASFAHRLRESERALLAMLLDAPPRCRRALAVDCGGVAEAAARLLYHAYTDS